MARSPKPALFTLLLALSGSLLASTAAQAVSVSGITVLPFADGQYVDPAGLIGGSLDRTKEAGLNVDSERDLRAPRANAQTFVVSAAEYGPLGIQVSAFVMNFEQYTFNADNRLGVQLFSVDDPLGDTIPSIDSAAGSLIVSGSQLQIPNLGAAGTAVFQFDAPVMLAPGAYAWRFLPNNTSGNHTKWAVSQDDNYPVGARYEYTSDTPSAAQPRGFTNEDYHFGLVGQTFLPQLIVDRTTGNITLQNTTGQAIENIMSYQLESTVGALDPSEWNSVSEVNNNWQILNSDAFQLSESNFGPEFDDETISIAAGGSLDLGEVWLGWNPVPGDISLLLGIDDGSAEGMFLPTEVVYVGGEVHGDFNFDGEVDADDYAILTGSLPSTLPTDSERNAYIAGDINGDFAVDFGDIAPFRAAYELHNGAGSFAALSSSSAVPEPSSIVLLGLIGGCVALYAQRRRLRVSTPALACLTALATLVLPATSQAALSTAVSVNSSTVTPYLLVEDGFNLGAKVFVDRTVTQAQVTELPILMRGLDYVQTANGDRGRTAAHEFSVDLIFEEGTLLYLSIDGRVGDGNRDTPPTLGGENNAMDWVLDQGWQLTGMTWTKTEDPAAPHTPFYVYSLRPEGTSLTLYEQDYGSINMYSIAGGLAAEILPTVTVNTETGEISLKNPTANTLEFDYYEILSASSSLDVNNWLSLDEQNVGDGDSPVDGWAQGGSSSDSHLAEAVLLGSSSFQTNGSVSLGQAYDTSIDAQDLVFKFSLAGQDFLLDGHVEYVTGVGLDGDFNGDGTVDAADYTVWRNNLGGDDSVLGGNGNNDGVVDQDDYTMWKSNFGQPAPAALGLTSSQVPEPSSLVLVGLAASGLLYFARRRS